MPKLWLEDYPWNDGGLGPVELGPWDYDTRERLYELGTSRGRVYSRRRLDGQPGILWWKRGHYGYDPIFGPWDTSLENARRIQARFEERTDRKWRLFTGSINESMYRHRHVPPALSLRVVPVEEWCIFQRPTLVPASWHTGIEAAYHWIGPNFAAVGLSSTVDQLNDFARYHIRHNGWAFFAYSYVVPNIPGAPGLVFEGRGHGKRTAATGDNYGNGLPSTLVMVGQGNPVPTDDQLDTMRALHEAKGWGRYSPHSRFSPTACPGDPMRVRLTTLN